MADNVGVVQVELDQLMVALPGFVPEAVVIAGVAVEADVEPILIGAVPLLLLDVLESPEPPAHVVEHAVQHHPQSGVVERAAYPLEVLVCSQPAVHCIVVPGVVAVPVALEQGVEEYRIGPGFFDMLNPVQHAEDSVGLDAVVVPRRAAQPQGIDLINYRFIEPHID